MDAIIQSLQTYYGLDWLAFMMGCTGAWMITNKKSLGFLLCTIGCMCGFAIALMSNQYGFVFSNLCFVLINVRGYINWQKDEAPSYDGYAHIKAEAAAE